MTFTVMHRLAPYDATTPALRETNLMTKFDADIVHCGIFPLFGTQTDDAIKLWKFLFTDDGPDGFQRTSGSPSLHSVANGNRDGFTILLSTQTGRVDLQLNKQVAEPYDPDDGPPRITNVDEALIVAQRLAAELCEHLKPARIAVTCDLASTVDEDEADIRALELVKPVGLPGDTTDLLFRINRRRDFVSTPGLEMNRLCTIQSGRVGFAPANQVVNTAHLPTHPFVGFKIDVNSAPEMQIPDGSAETVLNEIFDEIFDIKANGIGVIL